MEKSVHALMFDGALLARGFWLYVWEITRPDGTKIYYVGRTGDSSSVNAQSPFNRMAQHFSLNGKGNVLRRRLARQDLDLTLEACSFRMVAHGPILQEAGGLELHRKHRDEMAALEKALAAAMSEAGYSVMNAVPCLKPLNADRFADVRSAFATHFPALRNPVGLAKATR